MENSMEKQYVFFGKIVIILLAKITAYAPTTIQTKVSQYITLANQTTLTTKDNENRITTANDEANSYPQQTI